MRTLILFFILFCTLQKAFSQSSQYINASTISTGFNSLKINPVDGSKVYVGYINDPSTGFGNDFFYIKMNAQKQIIWQKKIANAGNDFLAKVILCRNGDYVIIGKIVIGGIPRGYVARINNADGNIIWSTTTAAANSQYGDELFDVTETSSGNLCIVGINNFTAPLSNGLAILLNSNGTQIWAKVSNFNGSDGLSSVVQLPSGNLLVNGLYDNSGGYNCDVLELSEATGTTVSEYIYRINLGVTNAGVFVNSMWPSKSYIKNGQIYFSMIVFQGYGGGATLQYLSKFDPVSKTINGNIYTFAPNANPTAYSFYPINDNDLLITQSYQGNNSFVARVSNGNIIYQRKLNTSIEGIRDFDINSNEVAFAGGYIADNKVNGYQLNSDLNFPVSNLACTITDVSNFGMQTANLSPTSSGAVILTDINNMFPIVAPSTNTTLAVTILCGACAAPTLTTQPGDAAICSGEDTLFVVNADPQFSFQWQVNAGSGWSNITNNANYNDANTNALSIVNATTAMNNYMFRCVVTNNCSSVTSAAAKLTVNTAASLGFINNRYPSVNASPNQPVQLQARQVLSALYNWLPSVGLSDAAIANPLFIGSQDREYLINIEVANGCEITDTLLVKIKKETGIYVPTAFTPGGTNRTLYPFLVGITQLKYFKIYNRWGNLIFQTTDATPSRGWNGTFKGKLQPSETYTWIAEGIDFNGITLKRGGNSLLIR